MMHRRLSSFMSLIALVLAVASVTSVGFFADRLQQALTGEARQLLGADVVLVMGGLLHDTLEDTDSTREDLEERFGPAGAGVCGAPPPRFWRAATAVRVMATKERAMAVVSRARMPGMIRCPAFISRRSRVRRRVFRAPDAVQERRRC